MAWKSEIFILFFEIDRKMKKSDKHLNIFSRKLKKENYENQIN